MPPKRLLLVGLEPREIELIRKKVNILVIAYDMLPNAKLVEGRLYVESLKTPEKYLEVHKVIYHGIIENDFDFINMLALWNGECLPNPLGMLDCRLRHPALVRALRVSKFSSAKRGMSIKPENWSSQTEVVAKWGNWHCGENKHKFSGTWQTQESTVFEPFIKGEAVRIMLIGKTAWQIQLTGEDWLKSIHHQDSDEMPIDPELLEDAQNLAQHFGLEMVGIDYMVAENGEKHLLEVNHIPNVTVFPFVNKVFIEYAIKFANE